MLIYRKYYSYYVTLEEGDFFLEKCGKIVLFYENFHAKIATISRQFINANT